MKRKAFSASAWVWIGIAIGAVFSVRFVFAFFAIPSSARGEAFSTAWIAVGVFAFGAALILAGAGIGAARARRLAGRFPLSLVINGRMTSTVRTFLRSDQADSQPTSSAPIFGFSLVITEMGVEFWGGIFRLIPLRALVWNEVTDVDTRTERVGLSSSYTLSMAFGGVRAPISFPVASNEGLGLSLKTDHSLSEFATAALEKKQIGERNSDSIQ
jgi:hypothetical protein